MDYNAIKPHILSCRAIEIALVSMFRKLRDYRFNILFYLLETTLREYPCISVPKILKCAIAFIFDMAPVAVSWWLKGIKILQDARLPQLEAAGIRHNGINSVNCVHIACSS